MPIRNRTIPQIFPADATRVQRGPITRYSSASDRLEEIYDVYNLDGSTTQHTRTIQKPLYNPNGFWNLPGMNYLWNSPFAHSVKSVVTKQLGIPWGQTITESDLLPSRYNALANMLHTLKKDPKFNALKEGEHYSINTKEVYDGYAPARTSIDKGLGEGRDYAEYTLGAIDLVRAKDGYSIRDVYDFNKGQGQYNGDTGLYPTYRRFVGTYGHQDTDPYSHKMKHSIFIPDAHVVGGRNENSAFDIWAPSLSRARIKSKIRQIPKRK